jgi:hypothetical protein
VTECLGITMAPPKSEQGWIWLKHPGITLLVDYVIRRGKARTRNGSSASATSIHISYSSIHKSHSRHSNPTTTTSPSTFPVPPRIFLDVFTQPSSPTHPIGPLQFLATNSHTQRRQQMQLLLASIPRNRRRTGSHRARLSSNRHQALQPPHRQCLSRRTHTT